jgi:hypothetical protein
VPHNHQRPHTHHSDHGIPDDDDYPAAAMLKYEHRIGFDLGVFLPGFIFIFVRLWIRNRNRLPNPPLTWILSDVFVSFSLIIAASVISLDIWYMRREIELRNYPKEDNPLGYFLEAAKISVEFLKVYALALLETSLYIGY